MAVRLIKLALPTALVIAVSLVVACGGGSDKSTPTPAPTPTPEASETPKPFDATPTPTPPPATTEVGMEVTEFVIKPDTARARPGTVVFNVRNTGQLTHQFLVIRSDLPIAELPRKPGDAGVDETQVDVVGRIAGIDPGGSADVSVPVETGKYVLICNLFAGGKSHYLTGMYRAFEVTPTAPEPSVTAPGSPSPTP